MKRLILLVFSVCFLIVGCGYFERLFEKQKPVVVPLPPVVKIQEESKLSERKFVYYRKVTIIEEVRPIETQEEKDAYLAFLREKR